jgi:ribosomal-protein-alanine N-acetyltransferase
LELETERLRLVLQTREEIEQMIDAMSEYERAQVSPDWLARMRASKAPDPWVHAFVLVERETGVAVGTCSFKGPPRDGAVEIAYGVDPDHAGKGYATEAARALVDYASSSTGVRLVRAHTLPDGSASKRVLIKCGFRYVGEVVDPEDGTVSRFEKAVHDADDAS